MSETQFNPLNPTQVQFLKDFAGHDSYNEFTPPTTMKFNNETGEFEKTEKTMELDHEITSQEVHHEENDIEPIDEPVEERQTNKTKEAFAKAGQFLGSAIKTVAFGFVGVLSAIAALTVGAPAGLVGFCIASVAGNIAKQRASDKMPLFNKPDQFEINKEILKDPHLRRSIMAAVILMAPAVLACVSFSIAYKSALGN